MEKFIRYIYNSEITTSALAHYEIDPENTTLLDGFESFIYNVHKEGREFILRIGHNSRRTADLVQGESEFINHLAKGSLSVPKVIPSLFGNLVETIPAEDGSQFLTTLFTKAKGKPPSRDTWAAPLFELMGCFMGKLHHLSKSFQPSQPRFSRYDIERDFAEMYAIGKRNLPKEDEPILQAYLDTIQVIRQLPKGRENYGLCHVDFHSGNFFVSEDGDITLFDFDDCQYAWFIYDIAMALFYAIPHNCRTPKDLRMAETFLSHFWKGYLRENILEPNWLEAIPHFLRLREIDLYMVIHRSMDLENLDSWSASYMDHRREKILSQVPYCEINYMNI